MVGFGLDAGQKNLSARKSRILSSLVGDVPGEQRGFLHPIKVGAPGRVVAKRRRVTQDNETTFGAGNGHVQSTMVGKEADFPSFVGPHR